MIRRLSLRWSKKKRSLTKNLIWLAMILVLTGLSVLGIGYTLLNKYHKEVEKLEYEITDMYMTKTNQTFNLLNTSVRSMLFSGTEIAKVSEAYQKTLYHQPEDYTLNDVLIQNNSVIDLKQAFVDMFSTYGQEFNFFYYDTKHQVMTEYGGCDYVIRKPFIDLLKSKEADGTLMYTKAGKWFVMDNYLCTIYEGPKGIGGAWVRAEDFARSILNLSPTKSSSIEIYDAQTQRVLVYTLQKNGSLAASETVKSDVKYHAMNNARFLCRFIMDIRDYENTMVYPMVFLVLIIIYMMIVCGVLIYTKKNIFGQVRYFYDHLLAYKDSAGFNEESGLIEFAEAGKVFNQLSEEIQKLKIDIYEEQLAKRAVELDYAQLQIRPHFYINCLNIIYSMAQVNRTEEIQKIALAVSTYLRYIFKKSMEPIALQKEIEFTGNYLRVLECMNGEKYCCRMEIDENLRDFGIPPLLIQTFVENSLKHNMDSADTFRICVRAEQVKMDQTPGCCITIEDNGCGFDADVLERLNAGEFMEREGYHIGIKNAVARMKMLYGENSGVHFCNSGSGGARVEIFIPV